VTEQECDQVYGQLIAIMEQAHLGWVVVQLQEQIRFGVPVEREVSTPKHSVLTQDSGFTGRPKKRRRRQSTITFISTRPFTSRERFLLLIEAVKQAVVNTGEMEQVFLQDFAKQVDGRVDAVEFRPEETAAARASLTPQDSSTRAGHVASLSRLLGELRQAASSAN